MTEVGWLLTNATESLGDLGEHLFAKQDQNSQFVFIMTLHLIYYNMILLHNEIKLSFEECSPKAG